MSDYRRATEDGGVQNPRTQEAARGSLGGTRRGVRAVLPFIGPAFIASIAYIDPGNFATNIQGGAEFGYALLWVILLANLMAMLIQGLSAKLGIATGMNLAEMTRQRLPPWVSYVFWIAQEITAMATDLAEFLGAAIGINLLFNIPLFTAAIITGVLVTVVLGITRGGFRGLEIFLGGSAGIIALAYVIETILAKPDWGQVLYHSFVPSLPGSEAVLISVGIIGATVMPHAVYLHSGLTQRRIIPRTEQEAHRIFHFEKIDIVIAMAIAGLVNMSMLFMAAKVFHFTGHTNVADINTAYRTLTPLLGAASAAVFGISLIASGVSSSHVGTMAGQVVMQGFVRFSIPIWVRRLLTMIPALVVIGLGLEPTRALVISQVFLSFTLPIPVITLIAFTKNREIMGSLVNRKWTTVGASACAVVILFLNVILLYLTFGGSLPGISA